MKHSFRLVFVGVISLLAFAAFQLRGDSTTVSYTALSSKLIEERNTLTLKRGPPPMSFDANSSCTPVNNVFFVKTHKTGSTTLQSILNRYGYSRNLSFAFRRQDERGHVSYREFTEASPRRMFLPPIHDMKTCTYRGYNFSTIHIAFNKRLADTYMTSGTKYISLLRDPVSQWLSAYQFFRLDRMTRQHSMEEFLNERKGYWRSNLYSRNSQSFDLGVKQNDFNDNESIQWHVNRLEEELDLVLIAEYFDESLIVLKKEFCWSYEDILYVDKNTRKNRLNVTWAMERKIKQFNAADMVFYSYFKARLFEKIKRYGKNFENDLKTFRELREETQKQCVKGRTETKWGTLDYEPVPNASEFCRMLVAETLFPKIRERQSHDDC